MSCPANLSFKWSITKEEITVFPAPGILWHQTTLLACLSSSHAINFGFSSSHCLVSVRRLSRIPRCASRGSEGVSHLSRSKSLASRDCCSCCRPPRLTSTKSASIVRESLGLSFYNARLKIDWVSRLWIGVPSPRPSWVIREPWLVS